MNKGTKEQRNKRKKEKKAFRLKNYLNGSGITRSPGLVIIEKICFP